MTLRELLVMSESRARLEWDQTSNILSLIYNANRGKDQDPKPAAFFNPYARKGSNESQKAEVLLVPITALKDIFLRK